MKKSTLFRTLKEVGAFHAYKTNISTGKFDITEIEHASDPHHYLNSVRAFEWSKTIQGWLFWKLKLMEIDGIAIYGEKTLFRALKEVGAFRAYQINMNTGKFSWAGVEKSINPYNYLNSASSFDWMTTIRGWDFWNKTLDKVEEKRYLWKKNISLER